MEIGKTYIVKTEKQTDNHYEVTITKLDNIGFYGDYKVIRDKNNLKLSSIVEDGYFYFRMLTKLEEA